MSDPFKNLTHHLTALEEFERRQRQLDQLLKPSAVERMLEQADQARKAALLFHQVRPTNSAIEAAMARNLGEDLVSQAAKGFSVSRQIDEHMRLLELTRTPVFQSAIEQASRGLELYERNQQLMARFERPLEIDRLSAVAAAQVQAWQMPRQAAWESVLADRMARLDVDWALTEALDASAEAFGRLGRLADIARYGAPYVDETADAFVEDLGTPTKSPDTPETVEAREERYDGAGRDRELIAFPPNGYGKIMVSAGFAISFPAAPPLVVVAGLIEPVQYSPETGQLLQSLEAHLRQFVVTHLEASVGHAWFKQRVSHEMRLEWNRLAREAEAKGKPVFPPIQYANFMDLFEVVSRKDNWEIFGPIFKSRENLQMSMLRLYSIRNDVAHSRPISMTDALIAMTESTLLFRAIGLGVTYDA